MALSNTESYGINSRTWQNVSAQADGPLTGQFSDLYNDIEGDTIYDGLYIIHEDNIEDSGKAPIEKCHPFLKIFLGLPTYSTLSSDQRTSLSSNTQGDMIAFTNPKLEKALGPVNNYQYAISAWNKDTTQFQVVQEESYDSGAKDTIIFNSFSGFLLNYGEEDIVDGKSGGSFKPSISIKFPPTMSFIRYTGETLQDGIISQELQIKDLM